jgi:hypothetical protein
MRKRKQIDIKFKCNKCGKDQPKDEEQSNENWSVYPADAKCECGGIFEVVVV